MKNKSTTVFENFLNLQREKQHNKQLIISDNYRK